MSRRTWDRIRLATDTGDDGWELFHENSKLSRYSTSPPRELVLQRMDRLYESLPFDQYLSVDLPTALTPLPVSLGEAITGRATARALEPCPLVVETVTTLLHHAYGITRDNTGTPFPRPFRTVPSGGALYPLELFFHSSRIHGLSAGLYHYNPTRHQARLLRRGDKSKEICEAIVQRDIALGASLVLFITALFERSTFKYGSRGYRFALLEAGHVAQNVNLVAHALGLGCVNIGGFFDRQVDELLELDGVTHSTIYMVGLGKELDGPEELMGPI